MCGRFVSTTPAADLAEHFGATGVSGSLPPRWNVAPSSEVWVVHDGGSDAGGVAPQSTRVLEPMRWGLVPSWAHDPAVGNRMINARAETAGAKPSFRAAFRRRRCVVPVDGFYEWAAVPGQRAKQAWYLTSGDGEKPLALAGLWEEGHDGVPRTCTILTTAADEVVSPIHHRMPVALPADVVDVWLDPAVTERTAVEHLLAGVVPPTLRCRRVGSAVGNPRNDGPGLLDPVA